jgi:hypothetical protein
MSEQHSLYACIVAAMYHDTQLHWGYCILTRQQPLTQQFIALQKQAMEKQQKW